LADGQSSARDTEVAQSRTAAAGREKERRNNLSHYALSSYLPASSNCAAAVAAEANCFTLFLESGVAVVAWQLVNWYT